MEKQVIVTIGREFGSGGHEIGQRLAEMLHVKLYDRSLLDHLAEAKNIDRDLVEKLDEQVRKPFINRRVRGHSNSLEDNLAQLQFDFIREKADSGESFVVVGRCSDEVLRGRKETISIFVLADEACKIKRVKELYHLNDSQAKNKMLRHDMNRKRYHNSHSKCKWGDSRGYDLCVNSSRLGEEGTAKSLYRYIMERVEAM